MEIGEKYTLHIDSYSHESYGVGRIDNFVVMVPGALRGEDCGITIREVHKNYAVGALEKICTSSPQRHEPFCKYFYSCGGCDLQHMNERESLDFKKNAVKDALERIGGISFSSPDCIKDTIGMDKPLSYRNIVQYHSDGKGGFGFYKKGSHEVIDMDGCPIQTELSNSILCRARKICSDNNIFYVRHMVIRTSFSSGKAMLILVTEDHSKADELKNAFGDFVLYSGNECQSVYISIKSDRDRGHKVTGSKNILVCGKSYITDSIGHLKFRISPQSFFQVNPVQTEVLYGKIMEYAHLSGGEEAYDLYCGTGTISLFMASSAEHVTGVESVGAAVTDAKENALLNGIENVSFVRGRAEEYMPKAVASGAVCHAVVVDPPRAGCGKELLEAILEASPERVVYVSCNPSTLARDLKVLTVTGKYEVRCVQPVDMFPWTRHVETVVLMSRVEK